MESEINEILGLFDAPAFARRGLEVEYAVGRLHERCELARSERLDMVRVRLRQWATTVNGPSAWVDCFAEPIDDLWQICGGEEPIWAGCSAPLRRRRTVARDLVASLHRFNRRWAQYVKGLKLDYVNRTIELYNRYYILEKECVVGSARLAARHFVPRTAVTPESLLVAYPLIPVPRLVA